MQTTTTELERKLVTGCDEETWKGRDVWVDRDGRAYDAYPCRTMRRTMPGWNQKAYRFDDEETNHEYERYFACNGHANWANYFEDATCQDLERVGWAHISGGVICVRTSKLTRKQKDTLCIWGLFNGFKGKEDAWMDALDCLDEYFYSEEGN